MTSAAVSSPVGDLDYRPAFPAGYAPGVGIVGCGGIAKDCHLPAYAAYGVDVVGIYDLVPEATRRAEDAFPFVRHVFASLDELLARSARSTSSTSRPVPRSASS